MVEDWAASLQASSTTTTTSPAADGGNGGGTWSISNWLLRLYHRSDD